MIALQNRLTLQLIVAIGCLALLALLVHDRNRWKAKAAHHVERVAAERASHAATVASYRAAAERARAADAANAARVRAAQAAINERTADDYESRIAAARASAERLRRSTASATADPGAGREAPVPGLSTAAESPARAAGENRLPAGDALIATEQAIQLDALIDWVRRQAEVDTHGGD